MKINIKKNFKKSAINGFFERIATLILPFISRSIVINYVGINFAGAKNLFSSIFQLINLSELGLSGAITSYMYKPVAEENKEELNKLLKFLKVFYFFIGFMIFFIGLLLIPLLPKLIKNDSYDNVSILKMYLLLLINTTCSYWFGAYKKTIINIYQRLDVLSKINIFITILLNSLEILVLIFVGNIYIYLSISILCTILSNLLISKEAEKIYPFFEKKTKFELNILKKSRIRVAGVFFERICNLTRNSLDNVIISLYLGLMPLAIYNNYIMVINGVSSFFAIVSSSLLGGIANRTQTFDKKENYKEFRMINSTYMIMAGFASMIMLNLYIPFMKLWVGEKYIYSFVFVPLFVLFFYVRMAGIVQGIYTTARGLFWENRKRYFAETLLHVFLSFFLTKLIGISGIIISNIVSLFLCGTIPSPIILFKHYFNLSSKEYFIDQLSLFIVMFSNCLISFLICSIFPEKASVLDLMFRLLICLLVFLTSAYFCFKNIPLMKKTKNWIKGVIEE